MSPLFSIWNHGFFFILWALTHELLLSLYFDGQVVMICSCFKLMSRSFWHVSFSLLLLFVSGHNKCSAPFFYFPYSIQPVSSFWAGSPWKSYLLARIEWGVQLLPAPPDWQGPGSLSLPAALGGWAMLSPSCSDRRLGWQASASVQVVKPATLFVQAYFLNI